MRRPRNFQTDRCYHLVNRVGHRAFYLDEYEPWHEVTPPLPLHQWGQTLWRSDVLPYRPYVIIDGPLSRRVDGQIMGQYVWDIIFDISGRSSFDYWISQNVLHYAPGTRSHYKVTVEDGFQNVCGKKEFTIVY